MEKVPIQLIWKSRSLWTQSKKPSSFNPVEKAVRIQLTWESRPHSTQSRKPSPFNPYEKAVPIQPIWESRPHLTQPKKPSPFNPAEKAVPIQPSRKSRPHSTHLEKPFPFNPFGKAVPIQLITSELRSPFGPSGRLASRRLSARLEPPLKRLVDWVSWHQRIWASNAENLDLWTRIFRHSIFQNFHFEKFSIHKTHQI